MNKFIEKEFNYLSEVFNYLPSGYLIDKGKVGCGGTTVALEDDRDTIICVPFVSLVKNKCSQYNNILGVYSGINDNELKDYIKRDGVKKIMCTYDSLERVSNIVGFDYYLLVDELHLLFIQYCFRNEAIKKVLNLYKRFKGWCFLTATPIEKDLMLEELKDIPEYKIEWENNKQIEIKAVKCNRPVNSICKIINDFTNNKVFGNAHIFINSTDSIAKIIKICKLNNNNTRLVFSKNNNKYKNSINGIVNSDTTDEVKKINIYTSTCFEGCDLFDEEGKIFIVSEGNKAHTLYDISTQIRQIAGRIRNTKYSTINHLYSSTRYKNISYEDFKDIVLKEEENAKTYVSKINNDLELCKGTKESIYSYVYKDNNKFVFDPNLMKLDIFNYKCFNTYSLSVNINNEYNALGNVVNSDSVTDKLLMNENSRTTFKDAIIEYDEIKQKNSIFGLERIKLLKNKYPYIEDAYKLGMDKIKELKYKTTNIKRLLIKNNGKINNKVKVAKLLKTVKGFEVGNFITGKQIKTVLNDIYNSLNIDNKATIEDFREFAVIKDIKKKINGKVFAGYQIQYIKIK